MNEIEQKQIKEIAKVLDECCNIFDENGRHIRNKCNSRDCEYWSNENYCCCSYNKKEATAIYNAGYRNCKDKLILDKEKYEKVDKEIIKKNTYDTIWKAGYNAYEKTIGECIVEARKETAREIIACIESVLKNEEPSYTIEIDVIRNLLKNLQKKYTEAENGKQRN